MSPSSETPAKLVRRRLDRAGVVDHVRALEQRANVVEVRVKQAPTDHSEPAPVGLEEAVERLLAGGVVAVQVRFSEDNNWWCDTIMGAGTSFRLVRIREG